MPYIETEKRRLHYEMDGSADGPVLVLGHSLGSSAAIWQAQLPALRHHLRVLRYDLPGHGASPATEGPYTIEDLGHDLVSLLDALELKQVCYAGLSLGGQVGIWLAHRAPKRIERLALCCTAPSLPPASLWVDRANTARVHGMEALVNETLARWFTPGFLRRGKPITDAVASVFTSTDPAGYAGCCEALAEANLWMLLPAIACPTLLIAGAEDPVCTTEMAASMQEQIANSTLVVIPNARHAANLEQAKAFGDALLDHFASVTKSTTPNG